jgi:hypothetical protein
MPPTFATSSFLDRDMVMRFFGGGVGHSQFQQHSGDIGMVSDSENESAIDENVSDMEVPSGKDDGDSDDNVELGDDTMEEGEGSDNSSSSSGRVSEDSELESDSDDDGYDSF